ncbi:Bud-site selection protein [Lactarius vividus]|nr:Bud-site selection protein [Lactarius vividus]
MKEVKKAAKKAKAFETQKIVKKLKVSRTHPGKKTTEKLALETELDALKATDHNRIGVLALKSKLKKDKILSNEPFIQTAISKLFPPDSDVTLTSEGMDIKLESRLLSSKTLSGAVNGVIMSLCSALKLTDEDGNDVVDESGCPRKLQNVDLPVGAKSCARLEVSEGDREDSTADRMTSPEADTDDDEPDDSAELEGDTSSDDDSTTGGGPLSPRTSLLPSRSDSPLDRAGLILHLGGVLKTPGANSVFFPTLSNGFVPGDLDSDWSDGETRVGGSVRKNRRGQRARRAIWEKKYGRKAKHLQKQEDSGATRAQRSSRKHVQGSQAVSHSRPTGSRQYERANKWEVVSNSHTPREQKARRVDNLALHPSWEAKRRMKEKSSAAIIPAQGKRIKFDN